MKKVSVMYCRFLKEPNHVLSDAFIDKFFWETWKRSVLIIMEPSGNTACNVGWFGRWLSLIAVFCRTSPSPWLHPVGAGGPGSPWWTPHIPSSGRALQGQLRKHGWNTRSPKKWLFFLQNFCLGASSRLKEPQTAESTLGVFACSNDFFVMGEKQRKERCGRYYDVKVSKKFLYSRNVLSEALARFYCFHCDLYKRLL